MQPQKATGLSRLLANTDGIDSVLVIKEMNTFR